MSNAITAVSVFWPIDAKNSGFCYGWAKPVICIAGVLNEDEALTALRGLRQSSHWQKHITTGLGEPTILGKCSFDVLDDLAIPSLDLWISSNNIYSIIFYYRHTTDSLRFYSMGVNRFDAVKHQERPSSSAYANLAAYDFTLPPKAKDSKGLDSVVLAQFNSAKLLETMIQNASNSGRLMPATASALLSIGSLGTTLSGPILFFSRLLSAIGNIPVTPTLLRLKDASATIQQLDVRAEQADFFLTEVESLRHRSSEIAAYSARYTNFFNTVWLIFNDIIIGIAFGTFLCENHAVLSRMMSSSVEILCIRRVQWILRWLDSWPAGLKLNTELSWFYSHTFIDLIDIWGNVLLMFVSHLSTIIYIIGTISCWFGVTMSISVLMDTLTILSAHFFICYAITRAVYRRMLISAGSLWNIFRGKRYNVLRNRTDSWEYEIDQLLFGTIMFTLVAFLFPTVLVYYSLFAALRVGTLLLQAAMETLLAFMNHFPLFALMLRLKDPWRLPGGVYFLYTFHSGLERPSMTIKNQPVPLSSIFFQYIQLWSKLAKHYNPLRLIYCVVSGKYLAAIPRYSIRYNKIQAHQEYSKI